MDKLREEILMLCREGKKLTAIKLYCTAKDVDVVSAKTHVEELMYRYGIKGPRDKTTKHKKKQ